jgi:hypothetical protein
MTALSDTLTVSLVLVLLFGSIALYLYTRIQQAEQRINLLDSIVLELKMSSEVKSYTELPASEMDYDIDPMPSAVAEYKPFDESEINDDVEDTHSQASSVSSKRSDTNKHVTQSFTEVSREEEQEVKEVQEVQEVDDVEFYKSVLDNTTDQPSKVAKINVNYEAMNIKELHTLAKQRGITGATVMKKQAIIDALKALDRPSSSSTVEPGSMGSSLSSFLESSSFLEQSEGPSKTVAINDE